MCLTVPFEVVSVRGPQAVVIFNHQKREVNRGEIKVKSGNFVLIQNNTIIKVIKSKEAREILALLKEVKT